MAENELLKAAQAEVLKLEAEVAEAERRLDVARKVVEVYGGEVSPRVGLVIHPKPGSGSPDVTVMVRETKTANIERLTTDFLKRINRRATSGAIFEELKKHGVQLGGQTPAKSLSAYLSQSKKFDNDPAAGGYGLVEWTARKQAKPIGVAGSGGAGGGVVQQELNVFK